VNGWTFILKTGVYGPDYLQRAMIAAVGLGANLPQDAVYPLTKVDSDGKPLDGAHRYVLHFPPGQTPPAKGFWSLTMYNSELFFVANPLNRYTLSSRSKFKYNRDGSLDLYAQKDSPGKDKESNWLPAPADKFVLILRLYWPKESVLNGVWKPPAVQRVE
jgi:DNA sulfur modification protein DndE